ncbi:MAG TPA: DUF3108 domain-containing protein [Desulfurivibrio alkaliphilus]|uniref:DUF3108 domain-containing protein n=1 Tax=Desulfurivibrio alkaliphilus TaxID=427923 RepID=A0A7C2XAS4_9BACT|nr:DUF3108 domain-containing protein [Desulfurivibrio alkaliphilus]
MLIKPIIRCFCLLLIPLLLGVALLVPRSSVPAGQVDPDGPVAQLLATAYPVGEVLHYGVTWMGLKAGELTLEIKQLVEGEQLFAIDITAQTVGLLGVLYPVHDEFRVVVQGDQRLPGSYRANQRQGQRLTIRDTMYDQQNGRIIYQRDLDEPRRFEVDGPVHNEFSAFYVTRVMPLALGKEVVIPAFVDGQRHLVRVAVERQEELDSILGRREVMRVRPRLTFAGLYEKVGDPVVWLTNDRYRIPLLIRGRIAIGSLSATLTHYQGPLLDD